MKNHYLLSVPKLLNLFLTLLEAKHFFLLLIVSNSSSTLDCDAHIQADLGYSINNLFEPLSAIQELDTSHHICDLERTQALT